MSDEPGAENISCELRISRVNSEMSRELRISRVNLDMLMDLRQRKEKAENGAGGSGEMFKVEKIGK